MYTSPGTVYLGWTKVVWCYLTLVHGFRKKWPDWQWTHRGFDKILDLNSSGAWAMAQGMAPDGSRLKLEFNPVFPGYFVRTGSTRWSLSSERRPDIIIAWQPTHGDPWWACLDAKYRVRRTNLGEPQFSTQHGSIQTQTLAKSHSKYPNALFDSL